MTSPAGSLSLAQDALRRTLAATTAWQSFCGADDAEEAAARIYAEGLPAPPSGQDAYTREQLVALRPYAVVFTDEHNGFRKQLDAMGSAAEYQESGRLKLRIYANASGSLADEPTSEANATFKDALGEIIDGLCELGGQGGYLAVSAIELAEGPYWGHPDTAPDQGVWVGAELGIEWGV